MHSGGPRGSGGGARQCECACVLVASVPSPVPMPVPVPPPGAQRSETTTTLLHSTSRTQMDYTLRAEADIKTEQINRKQWRGEESPQARRRPNTYPRAHTYSKFIHYCADKRLSSSGLLSSVECRKHESTCPNIKYPSLLVSRPTNHLGFDKSLRIYSFAFFDITIVNRELIIEIHNKSNIN